MMLLKILVDFGPIDSPDFRHLWDSLLSYQDSIKSLNHFMSVSSIAKLGGFLQISQVVADIRPRLHPLKMCHKHHWPGLPKISQDRPQSLFYFVPHESHSQAP